MSVLYCVPIGHSSYITTYQIYIVPVTQITSYTRLKNLFYFKFISCTFYQMSSVLVTFRMK